MSESLGEAQLQELHATLELLRDELRLVVAGTLEGSRPVDLDLPIGRLSRVDAMQQQQMAAASRQAAEARLRLVELALGAFEDGSYGGCRRCEEPIAFARLQARPEARLCRDCQEELEESR